MEAGNTELGSLCTTPCPAATRRTLTMSAVYAVLAALLVAAAVAADPDTATAPECSIKCHKSLEQCHRNPDADACFHELNICLCQCGKLLQAVLASPSVSPSFQQRLVFSRLPASLSGLSDRARTDYNCTRTSINGIADCLERCGNSTDLKCRLECFVSNYDKLCVCKRLVWSATCFFFTQISINLTKQLQIHGERVSSGF